MRVEFLALLERFALPQVLDDLRFTLYNFRALREDFYNRKRVCKFTTKSDTTVYRTDISYDDFNYNDFSYNDNSYDTIYGRHYL